MNEIEIEFLSILMHHTELLKTTIIKESFFENKTFGKIFSIMNEIESFDPTKFMDKGFKDLELLLMIHEAFLFKEAYAPIFRSDELKIINHYKTGLLNNLNIKLSKRDITYDMYKREFDKINDIQQIKTKEHLTKSEIENVLSKKEKYIKLGRFEKLSKVLLLLSDDLVTIAGSPGFGKSAFILNLFNECINDSNNYCQYYNLEINNDQVIKRLISIDAKEKIVDVSKFKEVETMKASISKFADTSYYLYNETSNWERLQAEIISHLKKDKQNIVFIDYLGLIGIDNKSYNKSNYDRVTYLMKEIRKLCRKYNVLIFIVSQCDRSSLKNGKLTLHSLKDSGEVENSSTHVILLYEDEVESDFDFCKNVIADTVKNRNNFIFKLQMSFVGNKQLFNETPRNKDVRE